MYKYFKELDRLKKFDTYLCLMESDRKQCRYIEDANIPDCFFEKYRNLFRRIDIIDMLVDGSNEELLYKHSQDLSYEQYMNLGYFFSKKDEDYHFTKEAKNKIDFNARDLEIIFRDYSIFCNCLIEIYPDFKDFISVTKNMLKEALVELENINKIEIPKSKSGIVYRFPDSWYITPNGYLYNTGSGHQQGNLTYPFFHILSLLKENCNIPDINLNYKIKEILERGYVTSSEFDEYSNLIYNIPTILTPEVEHAIEQLNNIYKMSIEEKEKITQLPHYRRTYQRNIITLQIGYYAARMALFQSFVKLNKSNKKKEVAQKLSNLKLDEVLIRYSGFHKISSVSDKTITTSSINCIENFKEYLENGWTLDIIPGIIYDEEKDELVEVDFDWYYINKFLNQQLDKYNGKGKILINNIK